MKESTLEAIRLEHRKLSKMIEAFENSKRTRKMCISAANILMEECEHYAGVILNKDGELSHHLILLPGEAIEINWSEAVQWARKIGGELPEPNEHALLYANLRNHFEHNYEELDYWTAMERPQYKEYAYTQNFATGDQVYDDKDASKRARAIRRVAIPKSEQSQHNPPTGEENNDE